MLLVGRVFDQQRVAFADDEAADHGAVFLGDYGGFEPERDRRRVAVSFLNAVFYKPLFARSKTGRLKQRSKPEDLPDVLYFVAFGGRVRSVRAFRQIYAVFQTQHPCLSEAHW